MLWYIHAIVYTWPYEINIEENGGGMKQKIKINISKYFT